MTLPAWILAGALAFYGLFYRDWGPPQVAVCRVLDGDTESSLGVAQTLRAWRLGRAGEVTLALAPGEVARLWAAGTSSQPTRGSRQAWPEFPHLDQDPTFTWQSTETCRADGRRSLTVRGQPGGVAFAATRAPARWAQPLVTGYLPPAGVPKTDDLKVQWPGAVVDRRLWYYGVIYSMNTTAAPPSPAPHVRPVVVSPVTPRSGPAGQPGNWLLTPGRLSTLIGDLTLSYTYYHWTQPGRSGVRPEPDRAIVLIEGRADDSPVYLRVRVPIRSPGARP